MAFTLRRNGTGSRLRRENFLRMLVKNGRSTAAGEKHGNCLLPRGSVLFIQSLRTGVPTPRATLAGISGVQSSTQNTMKNINDPTSGKILVHETGRGEMTEAEIAERAVELAMIEGRTAATKEDH